jgi:hypothetical protein
MSSIRDLKKRKIKEIGIELIKVNDVLNDKKFLMSLEYKELSYVKRMLKSYEINTEVKKRKKE